MDVSAYLLAILGGAEDADHWDWREVAALGRRGARRAPYWRIQRIRRSLIVVDAIESHPEGFQFSHDLGIAEPVSSWLHGWSRCSRDNTADVSDKRLARLLLVWDCLGQGDTRRVFGEMFTITGSFVIDLISADLCPHSTQPAKPGGGVA